MCQHHQAMRPTARGRDIVVAGNEIVDGARKLGAEGGLFVRGAKADLGVQR